jgi:protease-4
MALVAVIMVLFVLFKGGAMVLRALGGGGIGHAHQHDASGMQEVVIKENHARDKIAVINIDGLISRMSLDRSGHSIVELVKVQLDLAADDDAVKAVILKVDSPGGEVLASDDIYRAIQDFQKDSRKPVVATMGSLAASGGYYVSAPCRWIVANELTITGSIGVIMHSYNYRGLMDKVGVRPEVYKSGKFKDMLSGDKTEISPEEKAMVQSLVDETFSRFKKIVGEGRAAANDKNQSEGRKLAANWQDYADGRVVSGKQAYDLGFVDELGNFDTAVERAETLAQIRRANLIRYERPFNIGSLFSLFGKAEPGSIKIDLGLDLPRLQVGRLYFLCPTVMH